jgi:hypothetical protein
MNYYSRFLPPYRLLVMYLTPGRKTLHEDGEAVRNGKGASGKIYLAFNAPIESFCAPNSKSYKFKYHYESG